MNRRRTTVAFQQVETTPMRQFRYSATGVRGTRRAPVMRTRADELNENGEGFYWCAADKPEVSDDALGIWVKPICITSKVPELARCEECGIKIRELQNEMRALRKRLIA